MGQSRRFAKVGYRSTLAASMLSRAGVRDVLTVEGGMSAYRALTRS